MAADAYSDGASTLPHRLPFSKPDWALAAGLFIVALIVYVRTLAPDVLLSDSGEFQVLGKTLGLAHTTGYPIYILLAKLFTFFPVGSEAYRVNLVSAFMGAISVAEIFLICRSLEVRRLFSGLAAILLLINPLFWWQSTIAEVYAITAAFFLAFLLCGILWRQTRDSRWLAWGGALGGLCLGLHHTVVLTVPVVIIFLLIAKGKRGDWAMVGAGVAGGAVISLAAYLAMASVNNVTTSINSIRPSASAYGMKTEDFNSPVTRVRFIFFSNQFKSKLLNLDPELLRKTSALLTTETGNDFGAISLILAAAGMAGFFVFGGRRAEGVLIVGSIIILFGFALKFDAPDLEVDFIPAYLLVCVCVGVGLQALQRLLPRRTTDRIPVRIATGITAIGLIAFGSLSLWSDAGSAVAAGTTTFLEGDRRSTPFPVDTPQYPHHSATDIVANVPDGSLILTTWDWEWPIYYVSQFEAHKPNLEAIEMFPVGSSVSSLEPSIKQYIEENIRKRPVFATEYHRLLQDNYDQIPVLQTMGGGPALLYRVKPHGSPP